MTFKTFDTKVQNLNYAPSVNSLPKRKKMEVILHDYCLKWIILYFFVNRLDKTWIWTDLFPIKGRIMGKQKIYLNTRHSHDTPINLLLFGFMCRKLNSFLKTIREME